MKRLLSILIYCLLLLQSKAFAIEVAFNGIVGDEGSVISVNLDPTPEGNPENEGVKVKPTEGASRWQTLATFQISSPYAFGFHLTASLDKGGWSWKKQGNSQGETFNGFTHFRLFSTDTANYKGTTPMNQLPDWNPVDNLPRTFTNGHQTAPMSNWEVKVQARWNQAMELLGGDYEDTLNVTIENGIFQ